MPTPENAPKVADAPAAETPRWFLNPRFQTAAMWLVAVVILVEGAYAVFKRENDFNCHIEFGKHFLAGDPYKSAGNFYPLGRVMLDAVLPLGGYYPTRAVSYLLAVGSLFVIFHLWGKMAQSWFPATTEHRRAAVFFTLAALLPLVIRDLDECGLQIFLVLMLSLGAYALYCGRAWQCGLWIAAAITYKATPLVFLPLLVWKRQWKATASAVVCLVGLNLLPVLYLGWNTTVESHRYWLVNSAAIMRDMPDAYPSIPHGIEAPKTQNASLRAGLARWVETYPPGHSLYLDHPLFFQFGNLPVEQAKHVVNGIILLLGIVIAWSMRRGWSGDSGRQRLLKDWAVACIFAALLSPLCWKQHLVVMIPAVYLVARWLLSGPGLTRGQVALLASCGIAWLFGHRLFLGRDLSIVLQSYHLLTWSALAVVWLVMTLPLKARLLAADQDPVPGSPSAVRLQKAA